MTRARVVGVVGGSGGVGASVLSCAVAVRAAAAGRSALLVDGCRLSGGIDVLLGAEQEPGLRWPDLAAVRGELDGLELAHRLPAAEGVPILAFDRRRDVSLPSGAVQEVLEASIAVHDVVVVDLPAPDQPVFEQLAELADLVVLVCGRGVAELAAASAVAPLVMVQAEAVVLCVRTAGRGIELADDVSEALELPLLGPLPDDPGIDTDLVRGIPPGARGRGPVTDAADRILARLLDVRARAAS